MHVNSSLCVSQGSRSAGKQAKRPNPDRTFTCAHHTAPSKKALALGAALLLVFKSYLDAARERPRIYAQRNPFTECVLALLAEHGGSRVGIKRFRPGLLTWNGHIDTLLGGSLG